MNSTITFPSHHKDAASDDSAPDRLSIRVRHRASMDEQLEEAVLLLRAAAEIRSDRGILITRSTARDFTIELHADVPFGCTYEKQEWRR